MNSNISVGIIISTYNNPKWLEKVFWGYLYQTHPADEIIIADDGSTEETRMLIDEYKKKLPIKHIWHEDNGFQKCKILNKAIVASSAEYLIFTDQDCIPRKDFIATHLEYCKHKRFLSGGYFKLPMNISLFIKEEDVKNENAFHLNWLRHHHLNLSFKNSKLFQSSWYSKSMNTITPAKASWNGCNASAWRSDILAVNGFNEEMKYGGEDREFGERLIHLGVKAKQIRYSAICLHLDHERPYKNDQFIEKNKQIRQETKKNKTIVTPHGIRAI